MEDNYQDITQPTRVFCTRCSFRQTLSPASRGKLWAYSIETNSVQFTCTNCWHQLALCEATYGWEDPETGELRGSGGNDTITKEVEVECEVCHQRKRLYPEKVPGSPWQQDPKDGTIYWDCNCGGQNRITRTEIRYHLNKVDPEPEPAAVEVEVVGCEACHALVPLTDNVINGARIGIGCIKYQWTCPNCGVSHEHKKPQEFERLEREKATEDPPAQQIGIDWPAERALATQIEKVIDDFFEGPDNKLTVCQLIGVLEAVKLDWWQKAKEWTEPDG